jgi:hypothetical protein
MSESQQNGSRVVRVASGQGFWGTGWKPPAVRWKAVRWTT